MTKQLEFHKGEVELDQYISENCNKCKEELIGVGDIFIGKEDDLYYCLDCCKYHNIKVSKCREI